MSLTLSVVPRHAQPVLNLERRVTSAPSQPVPLTDLGREEARLLATEIANVPFEACFHTRFPRTRETAELALAGRDVPRLVVPELNDIRVGSFEGRLFAEYRVWAHAYGPTDDCPGGGESRAAAARRYAGAFRLLLARPERTVLVVAHALPIRYLLGAIDSLDPSPFVEPVPYATPYRCSAAEVERAVERLERWCRDPAFT